MSERGDPAPSISRRRTERRHWDDLARSMPDLAPAASTAYYRRCEIALIQRFTVFLGDPAFAVATVLAILLVSSGFGSRLARARGRPRGALSGAGSPWAG